MIENDTTTILNNLEKQIEHNINKIENRRKTIQNIIYKRYNIPEKQ